MPDPAAFIRHALESLERASSGSGEVYAPFVADVVRNHLRDSDRIDFIRPAILPPSGKIGKGKPGVIATLQDRAIVGWIEGILNNKWRSSVIPYSSIEAVKGVSWGGEGAVKGLDVNTSERLWSFAFRSSDANADLAQWRNIVWNRLDGTLIPLWEGDHVTRWVKTTTADTEAIHTDAEDGRHYDALEVLKQVEAFERIRAATCGALRSRDAAQVSLESGTLFVTTKRLMFMTPTEEMPISEITSIERSSREIEGKKADLISISFKDGSEWQLVSITRSIAESEHFCWAVRAILNGPSPGPV